MEVENVYVNHQFYHFHKKMPRMFLTQNCAEKVRAYGSKKFTKAELHYCITRKELFLIYHFLTYLRQFLLGTKFIIRTDHRALKWLLNWEAPKTRISTIRR